MSIAIDDGYYEKTYFNDNKMSIMLPVDYEGMTGDMRKFYDNYGEFWDSHEDDTLDVYGRFKDAEASLEIEVNSDGERCFLFQVYGIFENVTLTEAIILNLDPEDAEFYYRKACEQVAENYQKFKINW